PPCRSRRRRSAALAPPLCRPKRAPRSTDPVAVLLLVVLLVGAAAYPLPPGAVLDVPADGLRQALGERQARPPAELARGLGDVHRVAPVVPRAVLDELDQVLALAQLAQDRAHDGDVLHLRLAAQVVDLAEPTLLQHGEHA